MNEWKNKLRQIEPYVPGEQPDGDSYIKLNTNENPYPPSPFVKKALAEYDYTNLKLYPSFECKPLKAEISRLYGVEENQIFLGNGSDEVIALAFSAFFNSEQTVLFSNITYSFYNVWCSYFNIKYKTVPLNSDFTINKEAYYAQNGGVVIANPNAPTGILMSLEDIEDIIIHNQDVVVIVDEAYIDFGGETALSLIHKYENVAVVRTFSKSRNLAGIRVGYLMANSQLIDVLEAVKNSFNSYTLNSLSQEVALASFKDDEYFKDCTYKIINTREWTVAELSKLGFKTLPSSANFIFTTNQNISAKKLFQYLMDKKIIVRYFDKPLISEYLRITIGTDAEMQTLIAEIKTFLAR